MKFQHCVLPALLILTACVGSRARDNVLLPRMAAAFPAIAANAGGSEGPRASDIRTVEQALSEDRFALPAATASWHRVRSAAVSGLDARAAAGELGPTVLEVLKTRVRKFDEAWALVVGSRL